MADSTNPYAPPQAESAAIQRPVRRVTSVRTVELLLSVAIAQLVLFLVLIPFGAEGWHAMPLLIFAIITTPPSIWAGRRLGRAGWSLRLSVVGCGLCSAILTLIILGVVLLAFFIWYMRASIHA